MDDEQSCLIVTSISEGVSSTARDEYESLGSDQKLVAFNDNRDQTVQHKIGFRAVGVAMRWRSPACGRKSSFHQRKVSAVLFR